MTTRARIPLWPAVLTLTCLAACGSNPSTGGAGEPDGVGGPGGAGEAGGQDAAAGVPRELPATAPAVADAPAPAAPADDASSAADSLTQAELERLGAEMCGQIAELRGAPFLRPVAMELADKAEFQAYARERLAETTTPERLAGDELAAKLLGLVPPAMDLTATMLELLEGQVGGYYDPKRDTFYVMDSFGGGLARVIMAHELTHALDDQLHDLDAALAERLDSTDAAFAYQALCEGSATSLMNRWVLANLGAISPRDLEQAQTMDMAGLESAPEYLWKPLLAAYLRGAAFLARTSEVAAGQRSEVPREDFERAFRDPPRSSEQILHPEKYWDPAALDEPLGVAIDAAGLSAGWSLLHSDTLGELVLALVVNPPELRRPIDTGDPFAILAQRYTSQAASGWGGDRCAVLARGDARLLVLASAWDGEDDAEEFELALRRVAPHLEAAAVALAGGAAPLGSVAIERLEGARVVLRVASGASAEEAAAAAAALALAWPPVPGAAPDGR
jgi:hypothetical protein